MESSNNTDGASLIVLQLTFCCGGLVPNRPRNGSGPDPCAGIVDFCSKPNSGTLCKTNHPASAQFLNKQMALKLGEEQLFCLKREKPSASYEYILPINCEKTSAFLESGKFAHGLDIKYSLYWEKRAFFHILTFYEKYSLYTFCGMFSFPKVHQEK